MQVNVVSITGKDFSPFSTDTLGSSCPSLPGLLSRCTQSNVQKRGILYPSFSQCRSSIGRSYRCTRAPTGFTYHCSTPSVNHGLCQSFWMLSIFSIIISAKEVQRLILAVRSLCISLSITSMTATDWSYPIREHIASILPLGRRCPASRYVPRPSVRPLPLP